MSQTKLAVPFNERNQSNKSKRLIKKKAKENGLDEEFVRALVCRFQNRDDEFRFWVPKEQRDEMPESAFDILEQTLNWPRDRVIEQQEIIDTVMEFAQAGPMPHIASFLAAIPALNYWSAYPLVSVASLHGLTPDNVSLFHVPESIDFDKACIIAASKCGLALWIFNDLSYAALNSMTLGLGKPPAENDGAWLTETCNVIDSLPPNATLTDLLSATSKTLGGNKASRMFVLEALGIIGVLGTDEFEAGKDFWVEVKKSSSHFHSNDWTFPMNFWSQSGRVVGAHILLDQLHS